jgi:hypothetical protein
MPIFVSRCPRSTQATSRSSNGCWRRTRHWFASGSARPAHGYATRSGSPSTDSSKQPYLLWFVAEDPVRNGRLPRNIAQVTRTIIQSAEREGVDSLREQLEYALRLVSWSWIARECDVQIELIDVLVDAGAPLDGNPDNALVNGNVAAAEHLLERGAPVTLSTALCLGRWNDVRRLARTASAREKQGAFILAALKQDRGIAVDD